MDGLTETCFESVCIVARALRVDITEIEAKDTAGIWGACLGEIDPTDGEVKTATIELLKRFTGYWPRPADLLVEVRKVVMNRPPLSLSRSLPEPEPITVEARRAIHERLGIRASNLLEAVIGGKVQSGNIIRLDRLGEEPLDDEKQTAKIRAQVAEAKARNA